MDGIHLNKWLLNQRLPSENELVVICHVSRMTARKALSELSEEGILRRVKGLGTFINPERMSSSLLEIKDIADEILGRGNLHYCRQIMLNETFLPEIFCTDETNALALEMEYSNAPKRAYYSEVLHFENDMPIQFEIRFVNPEIAQDYLFQNFNQQTPASFLMQVAPVSSVSHEVKAVFPTDKIKHLLKIKEMTPCLKLHRKTCSGKRWATFSDFFYPGDRYSLTA